MEKAIPNQSPGSRASPSSSQDQPGPSKERTPSVAQSSRSASPYSTSRPTKRPPGLPPLRPTPPGPSTLPAIRPKNEIAVVDQEIPGPVAVQILAPVDNIKTELPVEYESEMEDAPSPGRVPLVPEKWKEWISFKLEHFFTAVRLRADSDYGSQCPVPIDSGFKRYFCTEGTTTVRSIRELLQRKFCKEKNYLIHIIHPKFMQELDENMTLDVLAKETKWQRKRPLRILFTLIPPKEPPPSLEKEPMPMLLGTAEAQATAAVDEDEVQVVAAPVRLSSGPPIMLTPISTASPQTSSTPEGLQPRQVPMPMTPQYAMINPQMMARVAPVKRKRENSETTPPHQQPQQPQQIQMQRAPNGQLVLPFNPNQFTPQELQQLQMLHQRQQQVYLPQDMKNMRIAHMAQSFAGNRPTALYPVQVMSGSQMKAVPVQQANGNGPPGQPPSQANAALLHKLLLQQQAAKHQKDMEQMQRNAQQYHQMRAQQAQHVQLQRQALATAQRAAMTKDHGPPPAKKMAAEQPRGPRPEIMSTPQSASQQGGDSKKAVFQVPSPPSPPKPQISAATPSPPAISPVPSKINKTDSEKTLKPYMAKVSVQPILAHQQTPPAAKPVNSPPPSLSPVISNDNLDFGMMAKMKGQSLGRTFKETLKKNVPPPIIDGIRGVQVNGDGKVQISAAPERLELLRNSTIVPTL